MPAFLPPLARGGVQKPWTGGAGVGAEGAVGAQGESSRPRGAEDEDSAPGHSEDTPRAGVFSPQASLTHHAGEPTSGPLRAALLPPGLLCAVPGRGQSPWSAKPKPPDCGASLVPEEEPPQASLWTQLEDGRSCWTWGPPLGVFCCLGPLGPPPIWALSLHNSAPTSTHLLPTAVLGLEVAGAGWGFGHYHFTPMSE